MNGNTNIKGTTKTAYNYIDDLLANIRNALNALSNQPSSKKIYDDLETRYRVLLSKRYSPFQESSLAASEAAASFSRAKQFLETHQNDAMENTSRMLSFHQWENRLGPQSISKLPNDDPTQPGWVVLPDLKMLGAQATRPSAAANAIKQQMGDAIQISPKGNDPKWPEFDTKVRGTSDAWNKFLGLAPQIFDNWENFPSAKKLGLKSETDYNPDYASNESETAPYPLSVEVINNTTKDWWEVGNKKNEKAFNKGIRLRFDPADNNLYPVSAMIIKELGLTGTRTDPSAHSIVIYDIKPAALLTLSRSLSKRFGYPVKEFNDAITALTGQKIGDVQDRISNKVKVAPLSEKVVRNRIGANLTPTVIDRETFDIEVESLYPGAFNPKYVTDQQKRIQKDGMFFIQNRESSILADEVGAGKTAQSIVGAEYATLLQDREAAQNGQQQKKVLILTPLSLVGEHWQPSVDPVTGNTIPSKPAMYCGYKEDSITIIKNIADFNKITNQTRWVVVPYETLSMSKTRVQIARKIAEDSKNGVYGAVILDEIQKIKDLYSAQGKGIRTAISAGGIKHRIGLSGTPADNSPTDLYKMLFVTRHPVIYDTAGVVQQTEKGFTSQFLGGESYSNPKDGVATRINSVIEWARNVDKKLIVDLFASTFLRRTKNDMRPDLPQKDRSNPKVLDGMADFWNSRLEQLRQSTDDYTRKNPWGSLEKEMALAKVKYSVEIAAKQLMTQRESKVFMVTKYPDVAQMICDGVNKTTGQDGVCAMISGDIDAEDEMRAIIPRAFKTPGGTLPGKKVPLRCVVYTMEIGAVGLNFGMANKFIANDIDWNPSTNLQAEGRIHRIDTKHNVNMEYVYFKGTYDEEMFKRVRGKEAINTQVNEALRQSQNVSNPAMANEIANNFILALCNSLIFELHMNEEQRHYANRRMDQLKQMLASSVEPSLQPAANSWYKRFKSGTNLYRSLW